MTALFTALSRWWHRRWCALCSGATCVFCHRAIDTDHPDTVWMPIGPRHYECLSPANRRGAVAT